MAVTATPLSEQEAVDARIALGKRLAAIRTATGINQSFWYTEIRGPETREEKPSSGDRIVREYEKGRRVPTATQLEAYNEAALASENKTAIDLAKNLNADVSALITRGMPDRRVGKLTELLTDSEADGNEEPAPSHPRRVAISVPASRRVRLGAAAALLVVVVVIVAFVPGGHDTTWSDASVSPRTVGEPFSGSQATPAPARGSDAARRVGRTAGERAAANAKTAAVKESQKSTTSPPGTQAVVTPAAPALVAPSVAPAQTPQNVPSTPATPDPGAQRGGGGSGGGRQQVLPGSN